MANVGISQLEAQTQMGNGGTSALVQQSPGAMMMMMNSGGEQAALGQSAAATAAAAASAQRQKQYEISIEPNRAVKLECKLPQLLNGGLDGSNGSSAQQNFYWNFQRVSAHNRRPDLLCWGTICQEAKRRGIELDFDQASGNYNLLIRNATYKEHDGIYYCDYRDTSPDASQSTEIQLTILSK